MSPAPTTTIDINGVTFETAIEYFAFPLHGPIVDMRELAKLSGLPNLRSASFSMTNLDDEGLRHVAAVPTIEVLDLQETSITDAGLAHLERLPRLHWLRLKANHQLTNACIPHLVKLWTLDNLQLHETSVDQSGLDELAALPDLRDLIVSIDGDNFTYDALLALSKRMPECTILAKSRGDFRDGTFTGTW